MSIASLYHHFSEWIHHTFKMPDNMLHIHAGMLIWIVATIAQRRPAHSALPLLAVLVCAVANEIMDRIFVGRWKSDTLSDLAYTLFWPAVLTLALRFKARGGLGRKRGRAR